MPHRMNGRQLEWPKIRAIDTTGFKVIAISELGLKNPKTRINLKLGGSIYFNKKKSFICIKLLLLYENGQKILDMH